jgi:hypothetical protein
MLNFSGFAKSASRPPLGLLASSPIMKGSEIPAKFNICWVDDMPTRLGATSPSSSLEAAESVIPPNVHLQS